MCIFIAILMEISVKNVIYMLSLCVILAANIVFSMEDTFDNEVVAAPKLNKVKACYISERCQAYHLSEGYSEVLARELNATPLMAINVDKNRILNGIVKHTNDSNMIENENKHWIVKGYNGQSYEIGVISQTPERSLFAQYALNKKGKRKAIRLVLVCWDRNAQ